MNKDVPMGLEPSVVSQEEIKHFYQLLRCNYIQQYFEADASGKAPALDLTIWSTQLCHCLEAHCDSLADELSKSF